MTFIKYFAVIYDVNWCRLVTNCFFFTLKKCLLLHIRFKILDKILEIKIKILYLP